MLTAGRNMRGDIPYNYYTAERYYETNTGSITGTVKLCDDDAQKLIEVNVAFDLPD